MVNLKSRLDITQIFCDLDDFCQTFESVWKQAHLPQMAGEKLSRCRMCLSEIMTIVIAFHGSGYRTFKDFHTLQVQPYSVDRKVLKINERIRVSANIFGAGDRFPWTEESSNRTAFSISTHRKPPGAWLRRARSFIQKTQLPRLRDFQEINYPRKNKRAVFSKNDNHCERVRKGLPSATPFSL
jgi:hypothetical protein